VNGKTVATRFQSPEELVATIPPELLTAPGTLPVAVVTPGTAGATTVAYALTGPPAPPGTLRRLHLQPSGRPESHLPPGSAGGRLDPLEEANSLAGSEGYPSISADGRFIVFQSDRNRGQSDVLVFDRQARTLDPLPEANHRRPSTASRTSAPTGASSCSSPTASTGDRSCSCSTGRRGALTELIEANDPAADDGLGAISKLARIVRERSPRTMRA